MSPSAATLDAIREAFMDALCEVHADARAVLARVDARRLVRADHRTGGGDVQCAVASALFHALRRSDGYKTDSTTVSCVSAMGIAREHTASSLARETSERVPNAFAAKHFADVRVARGESGMIFVCTLDRYAELRDGGRAMCDECGKFIVGGERGLWWHRKTRHGEHHDSAMDAVERERNALVALSTSTSRSDSVDSAYVHNKTKKETREEDLKAGMEAARRGDEGVMEALIAANRVKPLPLPGLEAARRGDLNSLRTLVIDGWDPSSTTAVDRHGSNALLWAAGGGHLACVRFLVESAGMDPEKAVQSGRRSYAGRSALHWAARNGHGDVVEYLLSRGVAADSKTADGSTAFAWAAWRGQMDVMRLIVEHGCDQHLCNDYGCNVACWTTMGAGGVECCEYLASLGVRFDLINANGHSTLHKAAQRGNQAVLSWLLDTPHLAITARHARPDSEGYAPADLARVEGFRDVADWLTARQTTLPSTPVDR